MVIAAGLILGFAWQGCVLQTGSHDVARISGEGELNVAVDSVAADTAAAR